MTKGSPDLRVRVAIDARQDGDFSLDVVFDVPPGVTVLFGPSGAGKSRTLACIAGIARPDRGQIALGQEPWFDDAARTDEPPHRRRAAYVFQSLALFPHMTAEENVAYGLPRAWGRARARERLEAATAMLERMRVGHLVGRKPRTFSGGEAQRVALARAFAMRPRVLLLDEPFAALDATVKAELMSEVGAWLARAPIPTILVTHDEGEARALGDKVVLLDRGRVVREAPPGDPASTSPFERGERGNVAGDPPRRYSPDPSP